MPDVLMESGAEYKIEYTVAAEPGAARRDRRGDPEQLAGSAPGQAPPTSAYQERHDEDREEGSPESSHPADEARSARTPAWPRFESHRPPCGASEHRVEPLPVSFIERMLRRRSALPRRRSTSPSASGCWPTWRASAATGTAAARCSTSRSHRPYATGMAAGRQEMFRRIVQHLHIDDAHFCA
jgi:hypothetical protein